MKGLRRAPRPRDRFIGVAYCVEMFGMGRDAWLEYAARCPDLVKAHWQPHDRGHHKWLKSAVDAHFKAVLM